VDRELIQMQCELLPSEYRGVRHIIESPLLATRCARYVREDSFDWPGLLAAAQTMSSGEQLLIRIAHDLWTSKGDVGLCEITRGLDSRTFERVLEALRMSRSSYPADRSLWLLRAA
jgi:ABC-type uncharacterized transport system ATPase subunit